MQSLLSHYVSLNVGGTHFLTSRTTLIKGDTMLSRMFSGEIPVVEKDGCAVIDRDGTHFRNILNFLRDGKVSLPKDETALEELKTEAEYYCIQDLVQICNRRMEGQQEHVEVVLGYQYMFKQKVLADHLDVKDGCEGWKNINVECYAVKQVEGSKMCKVPLNADGTMSLSKLRASFPSADQLCYCTPKTFTSTSCGESFHCSDSPIKGYSCRKSCNEWNGCFKKPIAIDKFVGPLQQVINWKDGVIFPPQDGWWGAKQHKYFVLPFNCTTQIIM